MQRWTVLVAFMLSFFTGIASGATHDEELKALRREMEALRQRIEALEAEGAQRQSLLDRVVTTGVFPGSITVPGTEISVKFGGFVKLNAIHDFDDINEDNLFATAKIQINSDKGGKTTMDASETRLSLTARSPTPLGELTVFVEGDFQGGGDVLRLRHAYGEVGGFLAGQTNSIFMDVSAQPSTLDNEGPNALVFVRHPLVRWRQSLGHGLTWSVAFEEPDKDVTTPFTRDTSGNRERATGSNSERVPDLTTHFRHAAGYGHLQLAGLIRDLRFDGDEGSKNDSVLGWGVNFTGLLSTFGQDTFMFQVSYGEVIGRYIQDLSFEENGMGNDAAPTRSGDLKALPAFAGMAAYEHWWSTTFRSVASFGYVEVDNTAGQDRGAYTKTYYASGNIVWSPFRLMSVGIEFLWGKRENKNGDDADARRLQFSAKYNFN